MTKNLIFRGGALALLIVLLGSTVLASPGQPSAQAAPALDGSRWILASYVDAAGETVSALPDREPTAEFAAGRVSGSAGCNTYAASFDAGDGKLTTGRAISTMMACEPSIMAQERTFLKNLQAAASYKLDGEQLAIADAQGKTLLVFQAVKPPVLTGATWLMTSYNNGRGGFQSALAGVEVTAIFREDGTLSGNSGCNTYSAAYTVDGNSIDIGPARTTRMMCEQPVMAQETAYLKALEKAATFRMERTRLVLRDAGGAAMAAFVQKPAVAPAASAPSTSRSAPVPAQDETLYLTILPAADASFRSLALHLKADGSAEFLTHFSEKEPIVETGSWEDHGDGTLTVTLTGRKDKAYEAPQVMKFQREDTYLTLVDYDKSMWGESGLKLNLAADVARKVRSAMVTLDLAAGFPLDPTFVSVNGGGEVDARLLGHGCTGNIHRQPVVNVNWTGEADRVRAFFYSDGDPTLVVLTPDGKLLCNDNAHDGLLDPFIEIEKPVQGMYRIWVGSAARNQLIPGVLVLTTKPSVDLGTFELGKLIKRPSIPQQVARPAADMAAAPQAPAARLLKAVPALKPGDRQPLAVTAEGEAPLFRMPEAAGKGCAGLVASTPSYSFTWSGKTANLRIAFEGDADATLMVVGQNSRLVLCNDDAAANNLNPAIDIPDPAEDTYLVFVGRIDPNKAVNGTLTVAEE